MESINAMKKIYNYSMIVAAAIASAACNKEITPVEQQNDEYIILCAEKSAFEGETKTEYVDGQCLWNAVASTENIRSTWSDNGVLNTVTFYSGKANSVSADRRTAKFIYGSGEGLPTEDGDYQIHCIYPNTAYLNGIQSNGDLNIKLASQQNPTANSWDPTQDIMFGLSEHNNRGFKWGTEITLGFCRVVAQNVLTVKGLPLAAGETVVEVAITAPSDVYLTGNRSANIVSTELGNGGVNTVTLVYDGAVLDSNGNLPVWFTTYPAEIAAGETMTIKVKTTANEFTKEITARSTGIKFMRNHRNLLAVDFSGVTPVSLAPIVSAMKFGMNDVLPAVENSAVYAWKGYLMEGDYKISATTDKGEFSFAYADGTTALKDGVTSPAAYTSATNSVTITEEGEYRVVLTTGLNPSIAIYSEATDLKPLVFRFGYENKDCWYLTRTLTPGTYYIYTNSGWDSWKGKARTFKASLADPQVLYCDDCGITIKSGDTNSLSIKIAQNKTEFDLIEAGSATGGNDPNTQTNATFVSKVGAFAPASAPGVDLKADGVFKADEWLPCFAGVSNKRWVRPSDAPNAVLSKIIIDTRNNKIRFETAE